MGDPFPDVVLKGVGADPADPFLTVDTSTWRGRWVVVFAWPKDFTFVCPTELEAFGRHHDEFVALDADLYGVSIDSEYVHLAWRQHDSRLADLPYLMLADVRRDLCGQLGILHPEEGVAYRATFIIDPTGAVRFASVNDLDVGRNVDEVVRVLAALQAGGLTACGWQPGDDLIDAA